MPTSAPNPLLFGRGFPLHAEPSAQLLDEVTEPPLEADEGPCQVAGTNGPKRGRGGTRILLSEVPAE